MHHNPRTPTIYRFSTNPSPRIQIETMAMPDRVFSFSTLLRMHAILALTFALLLAPGSESMADAFADEVDSWIDGLQSEQRAVRDWAAQKLLDGGDDVVPQLTQRLRGGSLELSIRGLEILHQLALADMAHASVAESAIQEIAKNQASSSSNRARSLLQSISTTRNQRAERILAKQGVEFSLGTSTSLVFSRSLPSIRTVTFDERWSGSSEDLVYLTWLTEYRDLSVELQGDGIDDDFLAALTQVDRVVSVKLGRCSVTDEGMGRLADLPRLRVVRIYYTDISDAWLPEFVEKATTLSVLEVFGSRMTKQAIEGLAESRPELQTRHGIGGFLGIRGDVNPNGQGCVVKEVTPNAAASKADIRRDDVIIEYNGHVVNEFSPQTAPPGAILPIEQPLEDNTPRPPSLSELIGKNAAGEVVEIKVRRNGRERLLVKKVKLGEWQ